jgi:hypothetical protein
VICPAASSPSLPPRPSALASGDPRLSLQERYGKHQRYVDAVTEAAENRVADRLLLSADADSIIAAAQASNVLQ